MPDHDPVDHRTSLFSGMLAALTAGVARHPVISLIGACLLAAASVAGSTLHMGFKTDRADLINPREAFQKRWINYTKAFGDSSDLVVVVEGPKPEAIERALDELGARLEAEPKLFENVLYKIDPGRLPEKGLQYLSPPQLETGLEQLVRYKHVLDGQWQLLTLDNIFGQFNKEALQEQKADPDAEAVLAQAALFVESLDRFRADRADFVPPWPEAVPVDRDMRDAAARTRYLLNDAGTMGFLKARPAGRKEELEGSTEAIDRLRAIVAETARKHPAARIGVTGIPVLENDEMRRSQQDMTYASIVSFVGVGLIFVIGFRGVRHPLLAMAMLAVGMAWSFGFTTLAVGHLNILSIAFAPMLIGLGDFSTHYLARYLERRHRGSDLHTAIREATHGVGTGIVTASLTTALAFFCAALTNFLGVAELGVIAGGGILLCAAATFLVLPALIAISDRNLEPKALPTPFEGTALRHVVGRYPGLVLVGSLAVTVAVCGSAVRFEDGKLVPNVRYDTNLLHLQAERLESVDVQQRVIEKSRGSLLFAVSLADGPEQARELRAKFEALPTVDHVEELASRLPAHSFEETQLLVQGYDAQLSRLPAEAPRSGVADPAKVGQQLERLLALARASRAAPAPSLARSIDALLDGLDSMPVEDQLAFLGEYQTRLRASLLAQFQALRAAADPEPVTLDDFPKALASRFVSPQGKWLLQVYPVGQIWDGEPLARFVSDVRSVDPAATGTPIQNFEAARQIRQSYEKAAVLALAVSVIVLLLDYLDRRHKLVVFCLPILFVAVLRWQVPFVAENGIAPIAIAYSSLVALLAFVLDPRSIRDMLLAMLPAIVGGGLMFGVMALMKADLNPANLIVLPLVLGIGMDNGVYLVEHFREQRGPFRLSASTFNAVVLTSATTIVGFGSMMLADHRGLYSVGLALSIGVTACLFVALVPLPAIFTLLSHRRPAPLDPPHARIEREGAAEADRHEETLRVG